MNMLYITDNLLENIFGSIFLIGFVVVVVIFIIMWVKDIKWRKKYGDENDIN